MLFDFLGPICKRKILRNEIVVILEEIISDSSSNKTQVLKIALFSRRIKAGLMRQKAFSLCVSFFALSSSTLKLHIAPVTKRIYNVRVTCNVFSYCQHLSR